MKIHPKLIFHMRWQQFKWLHSICTRSSLNLNNKWLSFVLDESFHLVGVEDVHNLLHSLLSCLKGVIITMHIAITSYGERECIELKRIFPLSLSCHAWEKPWNNDFEEKHNTYKHNKEIFPRRRSCALPFLAT